MKEEILNLLSDDYYSLWEIRDIISRMRGDFSNEHIRDATIDLVRQGKILCYISPDLSIDNLDLVSGSECIDLLKAEENWLVPTKGGAQIVRLTASEAR